MAQESVLMHGNEQRIHSESGKASIRLYSSFSDESYIIGNYAYIFDIAQGVIVPGPAGDDVTGKIKTKMGVQ